MDAVARQDLSVVEDYILCGIGRQVRVELVLQWRPEHAARAIELAPRQHLAQQQGAAATGVAKRGVGVLAEVNACPVIAIIPRARCKPGDVKVVTQNALQRRLVIRSVERQDRLAGCLTVQPCELLALGVEGGEQWEGLPRSPRASRACCSLRPGG